MQTFSIKSGIFSDDKRKRNGVRHQIKWVQETSRSHILVLLHSFLLHYIHFNESVIQVSIVKIQFTRNSI